jgi:transposase
MKPRKPYPSDISREQFELVRPLLEGVRKRTKPRTVDQYEVFNAVLYLLKSQNSIGIYFHSFPTSTSRAIQVALNR